MEHRVSRVRPSPLYNNASISYSLKDLGQTSLSVYKIAGQKIKTLTSGRQMPGVYNIHWDGRDAWNKKVSAGVYLFKLSSGKFIAMKKATIIKQSKDYYY